MRRNIHASIDGELSPQQLAEMRQVLRDLELDEDVKTGGAASVLKGFQIVR